MRKRGGLRDDELVFDRVTFNFPHVGLGIKDQARRCAARLSDNSPAARLLHWVPAFHVSALNEPVLNDTLSQIATPSSQSCNALCPRTSMWRATRRC